MRDEKQVTFERQHDPLAEPAHGVHAPAFRRRKRRNRSAQDEGTQQSHALEPCSDDALGEGLDVDDDVGQLRHC